VAEKVSQFGKSEKFLRCDKTSFTHKNNLWLLDILHACLSIDSEKQAETDLHQENLRSMLRHDSSDVLHRSQLESLSLRESDST
jgi:hypothetical protein